MFGGYVKLEATIDLPFVHHNFGTGVEVDATSGPTVVISENAVDMAYSPTITDVGNGESIVSIACTAANGFEVGKRYTARVRATDADGIVHGTGLAGWVMAAASVDDVEGFVDTEIATLGTDAAAGLAAVLAAITTATSPLATAASLTTAQADLTRVLGILHENSRDDNHAYDVNSNLTSCRKRVFASAAACTASTVGAANNADSEVARYTLTFAYTAGLCSSFKWVRDL